MQTLQSAYALCLELRRRVHALATIHQELYGAADLAAIDIASHLHALVSGLFRSYQVQPGSIKLVIDAAIPLSPITNELVTEIKLRIDGDDAALHVRDDGVGLSVGLDPSHTLRHSGCSSSQL